jgi:two-component sensor histidine kinase
MIVHELATNATKHGALSSTEGRIRISGSIEGVDGKKQFRFVWSESGGTPAAPPERRGFGSAILFNMAKSFSQNVEALYRPEGLTYELMVLLSAIAPPTSAVAPHAEASLS